jgi:Tfp pilus assembly protein PilF
VDSAKIHYEKALQINPHVAETHNNLGLVLARNGQAEAAIVQFQKALELKPDYADARRNLKGIPASGKSR